jgi:hypothetical protein
MTGRRSLKIRQRPRLPALQVAGIVDGDDLPVFSSPEGVFWKECFSMKVTEILETKGKATISYELFPARTPAGRT